MDPNQIEEIGTYLQNIGRFVQRTYPVVNRFGSQSEEDSILRELMPEDNGVYVDIGAAHPIDNSNTWQFYLRGWRGLLIEPLPDWHYLLLHERPGDAVWPTAAGDQNGVVSMRVCGAVSSVVPTWNMEPRYTGYVEIVKTADILDKPAFREIRNKCRFCSIDVEGAEGMVLNGIDWETFKPEVLCIEWRLHNVQPPNNDSSDEWEPLVLSLGYERVARTDMNMIYKLPDKTEPPE